MRTTVRAALAASISFLAIALAAPAAQAGEFDTYAGIIIANGNISVSEKPMPTDYNGKDLQKLNPSGWAIGGTFGTDYIFSNNLTAGFEATIQASTAKASRRFIDCPAMWCGSDEYRTDRATVNWFGTFGPTVGFRVDDFYIKAGAGLAFARGSSNQSFSYGFESKNASLNLGHYVSGEVGYRWNKWLSTGVAVYSFNMTGKNTAYFYKGDPSGTDKTALGGNVVEFKANFHL